MLLKGSLGSNSADEYRPNYSVNLIDKIEFWAMTLSSGVEKVWIFVYYSEGGSDSELFEISSGNSGVWKYFSISGGDLDQSKTVTKVGFEAFDSVIYVDGIYIVPGGGCNPFC